jgi:hypothetical protein
VYSGWIVSVAAGVVGGVSAGVRADAGITEYFWLEPNTWHGGTAPALKLDCIERY